MFTRTLSCLALTALSGSVLADSQTSRVPAAPPQMADVKTPSTVNPLKTAAPQNAAKQPASANTTVRGEKLAPGFKSLPAADHSKLYFDIDAQGTQWVRGATFKASFGQSGASFVPFFGSKASKNYPVGFHVASAMAGNQALPVDAEVAAQRANDTIRFERGGLVESYEIGLASIEQSFTFASLPKSEALELHLTIDSELASSIETDGIRFGNELGYVNYGRATVVDAHGRKQTIQTTLGESELVLRVPADFIAAAALPITIDPVITVFAIDHTSTDDYLPDVAYDPTTGHYLTVEEETFSASDHDVYTLMTDTNGTVVSTGYADSTTTYWADPRVANNANSSQFMVVAAAGLGATIEIDGRQTGASAVSYGSTLTINGAESGAKLKPDIGGDPSFSPPSYYLVTWERVFNAVDHDIHARLVTPAATNVGSTILIDNSSNTYDAQPRISKANGQAPFATSDWTIVWSHQFSTTDHDIYASRVRWDGLVTATTFSVDSSTADDFDMTVSSEQNDSAGLRSYMVCSQRFVGADWDIMGWVLSGTSATISAINLSGLEQSGFWTQNQLTPAVDCDGSRFAVTYSEQYQTSTTDYDTWISSFELVGNTLFPSEVHSSLGFTTAGEFNPSITSTHPLPGAPGTFMAVWETDPATGSIDVDGGLYQTLVATSFCSPAIDAISCPCGNAGLSGRGCENSATTGGALLTASGTTGPDTLVLAAFAMLPSANAIYLQGDSYLGAGTAFGDGVRCVGGQLLRLALKSSVGGASSYPAGGDPSISARCAALGSPILPGSQRFYQTYYRDPASFACSTTFNASNGLIVDW